MRTATWTLACILILPNEAMACFVLLSATGLVIYWLLDALSNRLLRHWHESARED